MANQSEINLIVVGDAGFKENALERRVANAMDLYRQGLHHDGDGTEISLDAVVLTGDNFEDQQFQDAVKTQFQEAFASFDVPFYVTLGNHDLPASKARAEWDFGQPGRRGSRGPRWTVGSAWPFTHYRIDLPSPQEPLVTLIELDSTVSARVREGETFLRAQLDQIAQDMNKRWVVVFTHYPLYTNGCHQEGSEFPNRWKPLLQGRVHFYLSGHNHNLEHLEVEDPPGKPLSTSFILSGAGGQIYKLRTHKHGPFARSLAGFFHIRFQRDKAHVKVIGLERNQEPEEARIVHSFERDFSTGKVTVNTPADTRTGAVPLALFEGDIGGPDVLTGLCGEPPVS